MRRLSANQELTPILTTPILIGNGYQNVRTRTVFRDFIDATANIVISEKDVTVRFQKRARNPYLLEAGFQNDNPRIPWLGNRRLSLAFG
jgi:hypothetical protein